MSRTLSTVALLGLLVSILGWWIAAASPPAWLVGVQGLTLLVIVVWVVQSWR